jgi:Na+-translocating ferredoxin:NAD+ oxidoreductase RnfD subunit
VSAITTSRSVIPAQAGIQGAHQLNASVQLSPGLASGQPVLSLTKGRDGGAKRVAKKAIAALKTLDPRLLQITFLGTFLTIGVFIRDFALLWPQVALTFAVALTTQAVWLQAKGLQHKGYLSALVTCFGISILVRAENLWAHPLVAAIAISSKFLIRYEYAPGKHSHLFNPANLAAVMAGYLLPGAWLSPGQWGQAITLAVWFFVLGGMVATKAARWDVSFTFLATFIGLIALRVEILGANPWIIWHQLQNGALLLFTFFMISDPLTTPRDPRVRTVFAVAVALLAFTWQFTAFKPNGPVLALFALSFLVPWLNRQRPGGAMFDWKAPQR